MHCAPCTEAAGFLRLLQLSVRLAVHQEVQGAVTCRHLGHGRPLLSPGGDGPPDGCHGDGRLPRWLSRPQGGAPSYIWYLGPLGGAPLLPILIRGFAPNNP